jgi:hypothetical protein
MSIRRSYAAGASATRIGSTSLNGCLMRGTSPSTRTSATEPDEATEPGDRLPTVTSNPTSPTTLPTIPASPSQIPRDLTAKLATQTSRKTRDLAQQNPRPSTPQIDATYKRRDYNLTGTILETIPAMTRGSCSPAVPSSVYDRSKPFGP